MSHFGKECLLCCLGIRINVQKHVYSHCLLAEVMIFIKTNVGHIAQSSTNLNESWWVITHDNKYHVWKPRWQPQSSEDVVYLLTDIFSICRIPPHAMTEWTSKILYMLHLFWAHCCDSTSNKARRHYSNNVLIVIYIWGTVMVDITKQNWQNIPIATPPKEKKGKRKGVSLFPTPFWDYLSPLMVQTGPTGSEA